MVLGKSCYKLRFFYNDIDAKMFYTKMVYREKKKEKRKKFQRLGQSQRCLWICAVKDFILCREKNRSGIVILGCNKV